MGVTLTVQMGGGGGIFGCQQEVVLMTCHWSDPAVEERG